MRPFGSRLWMFAALILAWVSANGEPSAAQTARDFGVGMTPAHFPNHTDDDVRQMFAQAQTLGRVAVLHVGWKDANADRVAEAMLLLARQRSLTPILELDVLEQKGSAPSADALAGGMDAYMETVRKLADLKPDYFAVATDINRLLALGLDKYLQFSQTYKKVYGIVKAASPNTKVFVTFSWDIFANAASEQHIPTANLRKLLEPFRPELDVLALDSSPSDRFAAPGDIPADYYKPVAGFDAGQPLLLQFGWPASMGGDGAQVAFVNRLPTLLEALPKALLARTTLVWPILHDIAGPPQIATLGLFRGRGEERPAAAAFRALSGADARGPADAREAFVVTPVPVASRRNPDDRFGIYVSTLSGRTPTLVISDPKRELNHARVSPDRGHVVFTRYNELNKEGVAEETGSPWQTEVIVCAIDGRDCQAIVPARRGIAAGNANWTPDGKRLVYLTNDRPTLKPGINALDLATHRSEPLAVNAKIFLADPNVRRNLMVMAGTEQKGPRESRLYLSDESGGDLRPLTEPGLADSKAALDGTSPDDPPLGDVDPKLSPDGRHVAFMRHLGKDHWGVFVADVSTGAEHDLSGSHMVDAVPEWSSDGRLLLFWHVDRADLKQSGLYTMRPDGSERKRVPLPRGFFYTMPAFFPDSGSDPDSEIIYSARRDPEYFGDDLPDQPSEANER